jgi:xylulokinase
MIALGIDSGTQSTKTIALDVESGKILACGFPKLFHGGGTASRPPGAGAASLDRGRSTARSGDVIKQLGKRKDDVKAIGVSGQQHGFVALDKKNKSIRPAKLWCDTSTVDQCRQFEEKFGGAEGLIELAGNAMLPGYTRQRSCG